MIKFRAASQPCLCSLSTPALARAARARPWSAGRVPGCLPERCGVRFTCSAKRAICASTSAPLRPASQSGTGAGSPRRPRAPSSAARRPSPRRRGQRARPPSAATRPRHAHVERVGRFVGVGQACREAKRAVVVPLHLERAVNPRELGLLVARREDVYPGANTETTPLLRIPAELERAPVQAVWPACGLLGRLIVDLEYFAQPGARDGVDVAVDAVRCGPFDRARAGDGLPALRIGFLDRLGKRLISCNTVVVLVTGFPPP